ncbi:helix-turn-helix transcriptional regulator [Saccharopolyspora mangrovi]|uniref:Helix-turn-helix domain-containing protein n=1 Tax=Saccharopolyspora mangrovi TaxID=3082379 RepID=A0ABU6A785_9PSEU|nr:helix-turn-helix domain-containing protein [Saccharopolyspora sp. S2-29]MEB3367376.1 helix-turn-helix domain-containing protein [Saccharopolyspora sp. S2-29]
MSDYLTTEELAALTRTSRKTVLRWRHIGFGPRGFRIGNRVLYARSEVDAWLKELEEAGE